MADRESGPTPAQEALALAKAAYERHYSRPWETAAVHLRKDWLLTAGVFLDAIAAGEVPGVFTADGEQWGARWPDTGLILTAHDLAQAEVWRDKFGGVLIRRDVGAWEEVPSDG